MSARALLDELHATTDAELVWLAGRLQLIGDRSRLTSDLRVRLRAARAELEVELRPHPCITCGRFWFPEPDTVCYWCRQREAVR